MASWFGVPEAAIPRSHAALEAAISEMLESGELRSTSEAGALAREVLHPPLAWLGGPVGRFVRRLTISELPPAIRSLYTLEWSDEDERALDRTLRMVRALRSRVPRVLTEWPESRVEPRRGLAGALRANAEAPPSRERQPPARSIGNGAPAHARRAVQGCGGADQNSSDGARPSGSSATARK